MRWRTSLLAVAIVSLLSSPADAREPVQSMLELRRQDVVVQEWDLSCGAAALSTLLDLGHGVSVPERRVAMAMLRGKDPQKVRARGGFSLLDMKRFAQALGLSAKGYGNLSNEALAKLGLAIVPIVMNGQPHFVVLRGFADGRALLADPAFGNHSVPVERFDEMWPTRIAFVVRAPGQRPRERSGAVGAPPLRPDERALRQQW